MSADPTAAALPPTVYVTTLECEDGSAPHLLAYTTLALAMQAVQGFAAEQCAPVRWLSDTQWECIDTGMSMWVEDVEVVE